MRKSHFGALWLGLHSLGQQSQLLMFMLQTPTFRRQVSCTALLTTFSMQTLPLFTAFLRQASAFSEQTMSKKSTSWKPASLLFISYSHLKAEPVCIVGFANTWMPWTEWKKRKKKKTCFEKMSCCSENSTENLVETFCSSCAKTWPALSGHVG